jgi:hypothetical protein
VSDLLVQFYEGKRADGRGRFLQEIQAFTLDELEAVHDYIQWLFPLSEPSQFNPDAPVLHKSSIDEFLRRPSIHTALERSFNVMMRFYGLSVEATTHAIRITPGPDFESRALVWLTLGNHNYLRLTRIIKSLCLLGLRTHAEALVNCLSGIYDANRWKIGPIAPAFWTAALS